jgi:hypothetical protein
MIALRVVCLALLTGASVCPAADLAGGAESATTASAPKRPTVAEKFLSQADHILGQLTSTTYRHRTRVVEAAGIYETDCKGLIAFLLRKVSPAHLAVIPAPSERKQPRAVEYYEFFIVQPAVGQVSATGWNRVTALANALPGDVLAWRYRDIVPGRNTGHVLILNAKPERLDDNVYRVAVIDSTGTPHDDDSRPKGGTGIGMGVMWFKASADGEPIAYRRNSEVGFKAAPIAIGRMSDK